MLSMQESLDEVCKFITSLCRCHRLHLVRSCCKRQSTWGPGWARFSACHCLSSTVQGICMSQLSYPATWCSSLTLGGNISADHPGEACYIENEMPLWSHIGSTSMRMNRESRLGILEMMSTSMLSLDIFRAILTNCSTTQHGVSYPRGA